MTMFIRRVLPFLAIAALAGAACEVPIKKAPPKPAPPTEVGPAPPGVNPCTTDPVVITGDMCDWLFQPDPNNATEGEFNTDQASIGTGSLKAGPIGARDCSGNQHSTNPGCEKFIAVKLLGLSVSELESIAFDFLIGGDGKTAADSKHFYLNVYVNIDDSDNFYDCRFDYLQPTGEGSTVDFTTMNVAATDSATTVAKHASDRAGSPNPCPETLGGMPEGSFVRAFHINVGDTGLSDVGLIGYLDNVQVATTGGTTTYDFEPA